MRGVKGKYANEAKDMAEKVAEYFEEHRVNMSPKKMTYDEIKGEIKRDKGSVQRLFKGNTEMSLSMFFQICKVLEVDPVAVVKHAKK